MGFHAARDAGAVIQAAFGDADEVVVDCGPAFAERCSVGSAIGLIHAAVDWIVMMLFISVNEISKVICKLRQSA